MRKILLKVSVLIVAVIVLVCSTSCGNVTITFSDGNSTEIAETNQIITPDVQTESQTDGVVVNTFSVIAPTDKPIVSGVNLLMLELENDILLAAETEPVSNQNPENSTQEITAYQLVSRTDTDKCGPSRLEMINAAKDSAFRFSVPWNNFGALILIESGFNAMRWQNGICETIRNSESNATCMGQFIRRWHPGLDWSRITNTQGSYENHIYCLDASAKYLLTEKNIGTWSNVQAWSGWNVWDAGIWAYKGCHHYSTKRSDGTTDCHIVQAVSSKGSFVDEDSGVNVSLDNNAVNSCWDFDNSGWVEINRANGETCLSFNFERDS